MTKTKRWLDELPLESCERELLLLGKSAQPAHGAVDADWRALCVALGTTAAAGGVATSSVAANSVSAKIGASLAASKAASAGLLVAAAKSLAVGVAVGLALTGVGTVAEHLSRSGDERPAAVVERTQAPARRPASQQIPTPMTAPSDEGALPPASSVRGEAPASSTPRERLTAGSSALNQASAPTRASAAVAVSPEDKTASLSQQARELAELKRLIDGGATSEALRRLDTNFRAGAVSVLSEERDALHVQALDRAQRRDEARFFAQRFLTRYPHSPYFETMRRLLAEK